MRLVRGVGRMEEGVRLVRGGQDGSRVVMVAGRSAGVAKGVVGEWRIWGLTRGLRHDIRHGCVYHITASRVRFSDFQF